MNNIITMWNTSEFQKPKRLFAIYGNESGQNIYATVSDTGSIYLFAKDKIIYAVVKSKCREISHNKYGNIYLIQDSKEDIDLNKSALRIISCSTDILNNRLFNFVINKIVPLITY